MRPPFTIEDDNESIATDIIEYNPAAHSPVMFGRIAEKVDVDSSTTENFDPAVSHPACVGYTLLQKPPRTPPTPPPPPPDKKTCKY